MADYIDSSILCESYLYVEAYELTPDKQRRIERLLATYAGERAPLFFQTDIEIDVEVREGSLKAIVKIVGSIAGMITFYGGLRDGIDYLYKDSQFIASGMVTESIFAAGVRRPEIHRAEVRTGVIGALKRVINRLDALERAREDISPKDFATKLGSIREEVNRILGMISSDTDREAVAAGMFEIIVKQYPSPKGPLPKPNKQAKPPEAAILRRQDIEEFLKELKRAAGKKIR